MLAGTAIFYALKNKYVVPPEGKPLGGLPSKKDASDFEEGEVQKAVFSTQSVIMALVSFIVLFFGTRICMLVSDVATTIISTTIYESAFTLAGLIISDTSLTKIERDRIIVIYIVAFFVIFFWAAFEQAGSSLTFIADNQTDRSFFGWQMPASMVQIFNGLFVVAFAVPFSMLWDKLRAKGKEPISPMKQAIGLALIAVSYFIIANNVKELGNNGLLGIKWLILLYLIQTCAELCLSPIGLSLVGKLSPKRFASLLYGVFFLSNASGYALAGTLGAILPSTGDKFIKAKELGIDLQAVLNKTITPTAEQLELLSKNQISASNPEFVGFEIHNLYEFFMVFVILTGIASIILFTLKPLLKRMMHGVK